MGDILGGWCDLVMVRVGEGLKQGLSGNSGGQVRVEYGMGEWRWLSAPR